MNTRGTRHAKHWSSLLVALTLMLLLTGCAVTLPSGEVITVPVEEFAPSTMADTAAQPMADSEELAQEPEPEPVLFTLLPLSDDEPLRARDVFAKVSPAVAYVSTPNSTGSAVLIEHDYLVTAAHVVWPHENVRVVFPDGAEFKDLPVAAWDLMSDVALLGPVDASKLEITPLTFTDGTDLPIGSEVYLVGYPAEFEDFPQPALGRGLLSRLREWDTTSLSMFQVDGDASGGQSGGAMLSENGELVGISNYRFTDSNSPMVTSSTDVVPALTAMLMKEPQTLADRRPMAQHAAATYEDVLENSASYHYYLFVAQSGDDVDINVEGVGRPMVNVANIFGEVVELSSPRAEKVSGVAATVYDQGLYLVEVTQTSGNRNPYTLTSSHPLYRIEDPDDDRMLQFGDTYIGSIDNLYDTDNFTVDLEADDKIAIQAESLAIDPIVAITYNSRAREEFVLDDDNGPTGLFGLNARAVFVAPEDGEYTVLVGDANDGAVGGYILTVSEGEWGDPLTQTAVSEEYYLTSNGIYAQYKSTGFPFTMLYPASYSASAECEMNACFESDTQYLQLIELSSSDLAPSERDPEVLLDMFRMGLESETSNIENLSRHTLTTYQGLDGVLDTLTAYDATTYIASFIYLDEDSNVFLASFMTELGADANLDDLEHSVAELFSTFRLVDNEKLADDPLFYLEQAMSQAAKGEYISALGDVKFALTLDEELTEAHVLRSQIHSLMGNYDLAEEFLDAALALEPDNVDFLQRMAYLGWYQGDYDKALAQTEKITQLRPDSQHIYNERALFQASAGNYKAALEELARYEEMVEDGLPSYVLDTRAFVHLKFDALEEALADYEEILADDFQPPVTLLGAGVTLARLDRMDEALPLLKYGMEKFEEEEYEIVDPQLTELLAWAQEILDAEES